MAGATLPVEVLVKIFQYLNPSDLLASSQVCRQWYFASLDHHLLEDIVVVLHDEASRGMNVIKSSQRGFQHLVFKEVDLQLTNNDFWNVLGPQIIKLDFHSCDITERVFVEILSKCVSLEALSINGCNSLFISGTLLEKYEDIIKLECSLKNLKEVNLACNRYLSDALFNRLVRILPNLEKLSLSGCQISFHPGIYKRFYPKEREHIASSSVFTFQNIMKFFQVQRHKLKSLNFGRTLLDSNALGILVKTEHLCLEELWISSCEQLSRTGIALLCEYQPQLQVLDLSLNYQMPDSVLLLICDNLKELRQLVLRRCQNLTDAGACGISKLKFLEKLDLSACEKITPHGFREALSNNVNRLMRINLSYCNVSDDVVNHIAQRLKCLRHLDLSSCKSLTDASLHVIATSLVLLRSLRLAWCKNITDRGLTGGKLSVAGIEGVSLSKTPPNNTTNCYSSNADMAAGSCHIPLTGNHVLGVMAGEGCNSVPVEWAVEDCQLSTVPPVSNIKGLRELDLCGCVRIGDVGLKTGISFLELHYLNLSLCQNITDEGLIMVGLHNPSLETLILSQCFQLTDKGVSRTVRCLPRLKYLDLQGCKQLTDTTLESLNRYCRDLRYLDISLCQGMTLEATEALEHCLQSLHTVHRRHIRSRMTGEKLE